MEILCAQLRAEKMEGGADRLRNGEGRRKTCLLYERQQRLGAATRQPRHRATRRQDHRLVRKPDFLIESVGCADFGEETSRGFAVLGAALDMRLEIRIERHAGPLG